MLLPSREHNSFVRQRTKPKMPLLKILILHNPNLRHWDFTTKTSNLQYKANLKKANRFTAVNIIRLTSARFFGKTCQNH